VFETIDAERRATKSARAKAGVAVGGRSDNESLFELVSKEQSSSVWAQEGGRSDDDDGNDDDTLVV
jgi:hypothetical protein